MMMKAAWICFAIFVSGTVAQELRATCVVAPNTNNEDLVDNVSGNVTFSQSVGDLNVTIGISLSGFDTEDADSVHGFHVHEFGDLSGGCDSTGSHFNPDGNDHGGPGDGNRHTGDLGNIEEASDGTIVTSLTDNYISLEVQSPYSIVGRAVVIHQTEDDLGESGDPTGLAGRRIACCVIGFAQPSASQVS